MISDCCSEPSPSPPFPPRILRVIQTQGLALAGVTARCLPISAQVTCCKKSRNNRRVRGEREEETNAVTRVRRVTASFLPPNLQMPAALRSSHTPFMRVISITQR